MKKQLRWRCFWNIQYIPHASGSVFSMYAGIIYYISLVSGSYLLMYTGAFWSFIIYSLPVGRISLCILEAFSIYRLSVGRIFLCMLKPIPTTNTAGCGIGCRLGCPRLWTPLRTWCNIWTKTAFVCRLCAMSCMYVCVAHVHAIKYANRAPALIVAPRKISRFSPTVGFFRFQACCKDLDFKNSVVNFFPSDPRRAFNVALKVEV